MNKYIVYFEIYGKKMKTVVMAKNEQHAVQIVKDKIILHKVEPISLEADFKQHDKEGTIDLLKKMFGMDN